MPVGRSSHPRRSRTRSIFHVRPPWSSGDIFFPARTMIRRKRNRAWQRRSPRESRIKGSTSNAAVARFPRVSFWKPFAALSSFLVSFRSVERARPIYHRACNELDRSKYALRLFVQRTKRHLKWLPCVSRCSRRFDSSIRSLKLYHILALFHISRIFVTFAYLCLDYWRLVYFIWRLNIW